MLVVSWLPYSWLCCYMLRRNVKPDRTRIPREYRRTEFPVRAPHDFNGSRGGENKPHLSCAKSGLTRNESTLKPLSGVGKDGDGGIRCGERCSVCQKNVITVLAGGDADLCPAIHGRRGDLERRAGTRNLRVDDCHKTV